MRYKGDRMKRQYYLDLAARGLRMPIGTDLVLHEKPDHDAIRLDGRRLGAVVAEAAVRYQTPLAIPLMDLTLEKASLLGLLGIPYAQAAEFHFPDSIAAETLSIVESRLKGPLDVRSQAHVDAIKIVATDRSLVSSGMCIGPFSLMTKLLADPITPVYMLGAGTTAEEDPEVQNVERALALAEMIIHRSLARQIEAGAKAIVLAEPAANVAYISPKQLETGSDVWERLVMQPNRRIRKQLGDAGVDLIFHCCGEITNQMLRDFASLDPVMLSLGSSRKLWEDALIVPDNVVLYGNLPTKSFYSDTKVTEENVIQMTRELITNMCRTGHPLILGSECDVLSVTGCECRIKAKVDTMLNCSV